MVSCVELVQHGPQLAREVKAQSVGNITHPLQNPFAARLHFVQKPVTISWLIWNYLVL